MRRSLAAEQRIGRRNSDEFLGLCIGVLADGVLTADEIGFLDLWVSNRPELKDDPLVAKLMAVLRSVRDSSVDGIAQEDALIEALIMFTGGVVVDDPARSEPAALPLNDPVPDVVFEGKSFCFTGQFDVGSRALCEGLVLDLGGVVSARVTMALDYLIIGSKVSPDWLHSSYGAKIKKAVQYRDSKGVELAIVAEGDWFSAVSNYATDSRHL